MFDSFYDSLKYFKTDLYQIYRLATVISDKISINDWENLYLQKKLSKNKENIKKPLGYSREKSVFCQILRGKKPV